MKEMASPARELLAIDPEAGKDEASSPDVNFNPQPPCDKLEIDNDVREDMDEIEVALSDTASVSSSLYESIEENGRTYHKYKEGKYFLPNDELEQNRLDLQHELCKMSLHGRLHLAPLREESLTHALDFGTGTGIWAMEFAQKYPKCQVIGNDLSPIQPEYVPQNLNFEVDDVEDEWVYSHEFTYIHGRLMAIALKAPLTLFHRAFASLSPGGYFEMQDPSPPIRAFDSSLDGSALLRAADLLLTATKKVGMDITATARYKTMMEEAGFVDVKEVVVDWPIGTWAKGEYHKRIGAWFRHDMEVGVEGILMGLCTRVLGMAREEVLELVGELKREMRDERMHAFQPFHIVYGRKPKNGEVAPRSVETS